MAEIILEKAAARCRVDEGVLAEGLGRIFSSGDSAEVDWQKVAAAAVRKRFCVISGGPGTGKTSTVVKIIALLAEHVQGETLRIAGALAATSSRFNGACP